MLHFNEKNIHYVFVFCFKTNILYLVKLAVQHASQFSIYFYIMVMNLILNRF